MKISRTKIIVAAALMLAGGFSARAQSNGIPGDSDYAQFSRFISDRNIFNPERYQRTGRTIIRTTNRPNRHPTRGTPYVTLVGTMSYEKGLFAFFDSNNSDLKKILVANDEVAGYTVKEITATNVTLVGPDKKESQMAVGDQMRQDSGRWELAGQGEASSSVASEPAAATAGSDSSPATDAQPAAPAANLGGNDILKRLMEKRAKEDQ